MSQISDIAEGIDFNLRLVSDVGVTYSHGLLPTTNDWSEFLDAFSTTIDGQRHIRAWTIQYLGEKRRYRTVGNNKVLREITFLVRAHLSMTATSETIFQKLLEGAVTAIDSDSDLDETCIDHDACDVLVPDNGAGLFLGDILVHYGEITVVVRAEQTL